MNPPPLPIDPRLGEIRDALRRARAAVVVAPPGAGKTTRIPPFLADDGPVIVLQPRRVAARALARRIAGERGWTLGEEVGWQVRFERNFSPGTKVLVATEGILTARLQTDPLLSSFRTVIVDEFHERSLHADLALALARQAWLARDDLRLLVMSATLDAGAVSAFLGGAATVQVDERLHQVVTEFAPGTPPAPAVAAELARSSGHILVFLPGAPEIRRLEAELASRRDLDGVRILPLHGRLDADEQDRALTASATRKVVLATNVAETSLTVEGVTSVIDTGLCRVVRLDPALGLDRLETERISADAATQRAGRAGRTGPGRALRLWDPREQLREHREPEIERVDLAPPVLEILAWDADPASFAWFEAPPPERIAEAMDLLGRLGAVRGGRITPLGELLRRLPVPPRIARVLVAAGGSPLAAASCAVLSERWSPTGSLPSASSDPIARADRLHEAPVAVRRAARELATSFLRAIEDPETGRVAASAATLERDDETTVRRAWLAGFPDRLARRRTSGGPRLILASGHGAVLDRASVVHTGELLLALDVEAGVRGARAEAKVRSASRIERGWLPAAVTRVEHVYDPASRAVRASRIESSDGLTLAESPVPPDPVLAGRLLADAAVAAGLPRGQEEAAARLRFADVAFDFAAIAAAACEGRTEMPTIDLLASLPRETVRSLDRLAPATVALPSGRHQRLTYRDDGTVVAAVKLQELFGLAETPRIGRRGAPVIFELLAPNGRPVQTTRDLSGFWERTYPEVRRELRGRYPRHPWPEDPWTAPPTRRVKSR